MEAWDFFDLYQNDYTVCPPGWGMTQECATFHRIYYVCGGEAYRRDQGRDERLEKGYLYVFPVMEPYTLWHNPQDPLEVLWFHVECRADHTMGYEKVRIHENGELYYLLKSIQALQEERDCFQELLCLFGVFLKRLRQRIKPQPSMDSRMQEVLSYLEERGNDCPTVDELASNVGLDRSYFCRWFQRSFHMSPSRYLLAMRMNRASKALMEGRSIWEAAEAARYQDEKAFSRAFRDYMEISPGNYRRKYKEWL
ncbi:MAG: AraC family transcriptional regulator [Lachnospiraceae bacterium]|jgi:AraC-like DNA-binding protein|nr:AraC family transcriptional regulator [Lachnospiraceae bacterium]MCI9134545.1 AraC family transcriptional regulator [Lachnospiraceae bacterium]